MSMGNRIIKRHCLSIALFLAIACHGNASSEPFDVAYEDYLEAIAIKNALYQRLAKEAIKPEPPDTFPFEPKDTTLEIVSSPVFDPTLEELVAALQDCGIVGSDLTTKILREQGAEVGEVLAGLLRKGGQYRLLLSPGSYHMNTTLTLSGDNTLVLCGLSNTTGMPEERPVIRVDPDPQPVLDPNCERLSRGNSSCIKDKVTVNDNSQMHLANLLFNAYAWHGCSAMFSIHQNASLALSQTSIFRSYCTLPDRNKFAVPANIYLGKHSGNDVKPKLTIAGRFSVLAGSFMPLVLAADGRVDITDSLMISLQPQAFYINNADVTIEGAQLVGCKARWQFGFAFPESELTSISTGRDCKKLYSAYCQAGDSHFFTNGYLISNDNGHLTISHVVISNGGNNLPAYFQLGSTAKIDFFSSDNIYYDHDNQAQIPAAKGGDDVVYEFRDSFMTACDEDFCGVCPEADTPSSSNNRARLVTGLITAGVSVVILTIGAVIVYKIYHRQPYKGIYPKI